MLPSSRSQSAATTALRKVHCQLFRVKQLREIPPWWILGRCGPPTGAGIGWRHAGHPPQPPQLHLSVHPSVLSTQKGLHSAGAAAGGGRGCTASPGHTSHAPHPFHMHLSFQVSVFVVQKGLQEASRACRAVAMHSEHPPQPFHLHLTPQGSVLSAQNNLHVLAATGGVVTHPII